jgi:hypothetical protein
MGQSEVAEKPGQLEMYEADTVRLWLKIGCQGALV